MKRFSFIIIVLIIAAAFVLVRFDCVAQSEGGRLRVIAKISWHPAFEDKGSTIIPGSLQADFGRFAIRWIVSPNRTARLVTLESPGAGELPPREKKLFLWAVDARTTTLFQEWLPMVNVKEPATIRPIVKVSTADLFLVPKAKLPPVAKVNQAPQPITWGREYRKKDVYYLPGSLQASFGRLNIYWKKVAGRLPELITLESPGAGELPPREVRLYIWNDERNGVSTIFQERQPLLNQGYTSYLWPLAMVRTEELMAGFRQMLDPIEDKRVEERQLEDKPWRKDKR